MSDYIDYRIRDGKGRFRIYSSIVSAYTTNELTAEELRRSLRQSALEDALRLHLRETDARIARARDQGTSEYGVRVGPGNPIDKVLRGPWRDNDRPNGETGEPDLDDMFFMVVGEDQVLGQFHGIFSSKSLEEIMQRDPTAWTQFGLWAELACYGETFRLRELKFARVLPPK